MGERSYYRLAPPNIRSLTNELLSRIRGEQATQHVFGKVRLTDELQGYEARLGWMKINQRAPH